MTMYIQSWQPQSLNVIHKDKSNTIREIRDTLALALTFNWKVCCLPALGSLPYNWNYKDTAFSLGKMVNI